MNLVMVKFGRLQRAKKKGVKGTSPFAAATNKKPHEASLRSRIPGAHKSTAKAKLKARNAAAAAGAAHRHCTEEPEAAQARVQPVAQDDGG